MRVLVIDSDHVGLDFCMRAAAAGHDVRLFRYSQKPTKYATGFKEFELVDDWRDHMQWARDGLIFNTCNNRYLWELDRYREFGFKIFGPTVASAKLEIDRAAGMDAIKSIGLEVPPYHTFASLEEAEAFARKADKPFVFKPMGDEEDKSLTYVSHDPADLVGWLRRQIKLGKKLKGRAMLQEKVDRLAEIGVSGWVGPEGFLPDKYQVCFEHKPLMSGDVGPATGEMGTVCQYTDSDKLASDMLLPLEPVLRTLGHRGDFSVGAMIDTKGKAWFLEFTCYDDKTEVLTKSGWKYFADLHPGEMMATLNPETDELEYRPAIALIEKDYVGEMVQFVGESGATDLCVTPDHSMWARPRTNKPWRFVRADELQSLEQIKRDAKWIGREQETFLLPGRVEQHWLGKHDRVHAIDRPAIEIPMEVWLRFLGLYIAEGSLNRTAKGVRYVAQIAQSFANHAKILPLLAGFPIPFTTNKSGALQFSSRQLVECLENYGLGLCYEKFIPEEFKELSPRYLQCLLDGLMAGDGTAHKRTGQKTYATASKRLAGDVQEIMLKLGYVGRVTERLVAGTQMTVNGNAYTRRHNTFIVSERRGKMYGWLDKRLTKRVRYSGKVYCATVPPHHLLYVRRGGVPLWCGNCRCGYPAWWIQTASHRGDPAKWMRDLLDGKDSLRVSYDVAIGVVMAQPQFPYDTAPPALVEGVPIQGVDDVLSDAHLVEAMRGKGPVWDGGRIVERPTYETAGEYVVVATGLGGTVQKARAKVYGVVDAIHYPNRMYRDDIGRRLEDELPKLHRFGYADGVEW